MNTLKELTGYPSIDKPWLKYHENNQHIVLDKQKTLYQHLVTIVEKNKNEYAFAEQLTNRKTTFREMLEIVYKLAGAMVNAGIGKDMEVGLLSFYAYDEPFIIFAANKIGAVLKFISPDASPNEIKESVDEVDILFTDRFFVPIEPVINSRNIKTIVCEKEADNLRENCILFDDFINTSTCDVISNDDTDSSKPSMIIYSSGTTGKPKPIVHSNYSILSAIEKMLNSDFPINKNNYVFKMIPTHIGLGVVTTVLTSILAETTYISIKPLDFFQPPECVLSMIIHYKEFIQECGLDSRRGLLFFASPIFAGILVLNADKITDLSFINGMLLAGSKMDTDMIDKFNAALIPKGLKAPLCNGYGQNEMAGAVALNTVNHYKYGSAGYPVYGTEIKIVDEQSREELPYNKEGLILEKSESLFLYYDRMPERSKNAMITLPDGTTWFNSTDLGYIDEDGFICVTGRTTRVVIRTDHKVSLEYIEEKIRRNSFVKDAAAIAMPDNSIIVFISASDNTIDSIEDAVKKNSDFSLWETPEKIILLDKIPYMNNGKVDYCALGKMAHET